MTKNIGAQIKEVLPNSIAEEIGLQSGDIIKEINSNILQDIIDYQYLISDDDLTLKILKENGEEWLVDIEKESSESMGIIFAKETFDGFKRCHNNCLFCFVDNLPRGLRKSLYIKDDDYRHSFLYGNYITLTNLQKGDLERIVRLKLSPLYVSIHTTDLELREKILNNKNAGKIMEQLKFLVEGGIKIHTQTVLCPGLNDGENLSKTISDLAKYWPGIQTLAIVPVGLTAYNKSDLRTYSKEECEKIIYQIEEKQKLFLKSIGTRFAFLSDEFYLQAGHNIPPEEYYEGYPQFENGVGVVRHFEEELIENLPTTKIIRGNPLHALIVTGISSKDIMQKAINKIECKVENINIVLKPLKNDFFGYPVSVTGLLTGYDLINGLNGNVSKGQVVLIPDVMLKENSNIFLDGLSLDDVSKKLGTEVKVLPTSGKALVQYIIGETGE